MAQKTTGITNSLLRSYTIILLFMLVPILYAIIVARLHSNWYNKIISNVSEATALDKIVKEDIPNELWNIISGQKDFTQGEQYILLRKIRTGINEMQETATEEASKLLDVATRTETTLRYYIDKLETQIQANATVAENERLMEEIRSIASLLSDILQEFIVTEIETASATNTRIQRSFALLTALQVLIGAFILAIALHTLNTIARQLKTLLEENVREQQNLQKAEMKTLQAQITPHFLYNTFDSIIWLAEAGEIEEVVSVTKAFSQFFRISLSRGHEWITVAQELDHVKSYLTIQKIRYANILDYSIESDEAIGDMPLLKLLLQPLVENAIYHGIKNKRGRGKITITARRTGETAQSRGTLVFTVSDNGIGFSPERLKQVTEELAREKNAESLSAAYGLYNVNKRLQLYYNGKASLRIESVSGEGTTITCTVPIVGEQGGEHV